MNDDTNHIHKYYAPFLLSNNHEEVSSGSEHDSVKRRVDSIQKNNRASHLFIILMQGIRYL